LPSPRRNEERYRSMPNSLVHYPEVQWGPGSLPRCPALDQNIPFNEVDWAACEKPWPVGEIREAA
jgi:hypothetical protein